MEPKKIKEKVNLLKLCVNKQAKILRDWMESVADGASSRRVAVEVVNQQSNQCDRAYIN